MTIFILLGLSLRSALPALELQGVVSSDRLSQQIGIGSAAEPQVKTLGHTDRCEDLKGGRIFGAFYSQKALGQVC